MKNLKTLRGLPKKLLRIEDKVWRLTKEIITRDDAHLSSLNQETLFSGYDSEGNKLGTYSRRTEEIKKAKGKWIDSNIRLLDEGDFYDSIFTDVVNKTLQFKTNDPDRSKVKDLFGRFGQHILGLPEPLFKEYLHKRFKPELFRKLEAWLFT